MAVMDAISGAFDLLRGDTARTVLGAGLKLLPPPYGAAAGLAVNLAPSLYTAINSFLGGEISREELQARWDAMLAEGAVLDAAVAIEEAKREGATAPPA